MIAAERTGRRARLIELDPKFADVIVQRWQQSTGRQAQLAETGQTFDAPAATRVSRNGSEAAFTDLPKASC
jgi:hypothetical protein